MKVGRALVAVAALVLVGFWPLGARAQEQTCRLDPDTGLLKCYIIAQPAPPRTVLISPDLPIEWVRIPLYDFEIVMRELGCLRTVGDVIEVGASYMIMLQNTETLELLHLRYVCALPGEPPPQPPLAPPTPGELRDDNAQALTLNPSFSPSLEIGGLTGLATWLWCSDPGVVDAGVTLRGWTARGDVGMVEIVWTVTGPEHVTSVGSSCGSEGAPALTWTPEQMGEYGVTVTAVWEGSWDLSWNGVSIGTFPLGPIDMTSPVYPYPVDEYRGELGP